MIRDGLPTATVAADVFLESSWRGNRLRRLYTTFPGGLQGIGLLFLRSAIGVRLIIQAFVCLRESHGEHTEVWILALLAAATGISFVLGFLTPLTAGLSALTGVAVCLWHPAWASALLVPQRFDSIVVATALTLLGPGAISVDAHLFARRRIVIPRVVRS